MASKTINIRWIRLEPVLSHTKKIMYSIELQKFFYEYQNKNHKINTSFVRPEFRPLTKTKNGLNLINFHVNIRGKLSILLTIIIFTLLYQT